MTDPRWRMAAGLLLALAGVVVAVLGYLGVSQETEVAFQLPYFASAGVGSLLLMGAGGILMLSAQLARDSARLRDLEEATRQLAQEVGRLMDMASPGRGRMREERPASPLHR